VVGSNDDEILSPGVSWEVESTQRRDAQALRDRVQLAHRSLRRLAERDAGFPLKDLTRYGHAFDERTPDNR
jgi:hypothetical protein